MREDRGCQTRPFGGWARSAAGPAAWAKNLRPNRAFPDFSSCTPTTNRTSAPLAAHPLHEQPHNEKPHTAHRNMAAPKLLEACKNERHKQLIGTMSCMVLRMQRKIVSKRCAQPNLVRTTRPAIHSDHVIIVIHAHTPHQGCAHRGPLWGSRLTRARPHRTRGAEASCFGPRLCLGCCCFVNQSFPTNAEVASVPPSTPRRRDGDRQSGCFAALALFLRGKGSAKPMERMGVFFSAG